MTTTETALAIAEAELRFLRGLIHPETMPGAHLTTFGRGQLAFAMIDNVKKRAATCLKAIADAKDADACPVCLVAFTPDDMCLTDIELGTCHAACLDGSPVIDLETGDPLPEGVVPAPYRYEPTP